MSLEQHDTTNFEAIDFQLLNKSFTIRCPSSETNQFFTALDFLKLEISRLDANPKPAELEKLLVTAALNLSQKLLKQQDTLDATQALVDGKIQHLTEKVNQAKQTLLSNAAQCPSES